MSLTAHIQNQNGQPWLYITSHSTRGTPLCVFDAPLDLSNKKVAKAEIDFAHERSGMSRPDLYDAIRAYNRSIRAA